MISAKMHQLVPRFISIQLETGTMMVTIIGVLFMRHAQVSRYLVCCWFKLSITWPTVTQSEEATHRYYLDAWHIFKKFSMPNNILIIKK